MVAGNNTGDHAYNAVAPFFVAGCIFITVLWMILVHKLYCLQQEFKYEFIFNFYRITATIFFTNCLFCAFTDTVHLYLCWINDKYMAGPNYQYIKAVADIFFFTASASLNIILFGRVYFTFKQSYWSLSTCTVIFITFQIITSILLGLAYCLLVVWFSEANESIADHYAGPIVIGIDFNDLTISISMLILFSYKLHQLVMSMTSINNDSNNEYDKKKHYYKFKEASKNTYTNTVAPTETVLSTTNNKINTCTNTQQTADFDDISFLSSSLIVSHSNQLNENQLNTIIIITRHTILSIFAVFFNQLYYAIDYISMNGSWESSYYFGLLVYGLRMIGMCGMMLSIYFSMTFAKELYFKCCACCHLTCYQCCIKFTRKKIKNNKQINNSNVK